MRKHIQRCLWLSYKFMIAIFCYENSHFRCTSTVIHRSINKNQLKKMSKQWGEKIEMNFIESGTEISEKNLVFIICRWLLYLLITFSVSKCTRKNTSRKYNVKEFEVNRFVVFFSVFLIYFCLTFWKFPSRLPFIRTD